MTNFFPKQDLQNQLLINGDFNIDQLATPSYTGIANLTYFADMWQFIHYGTSVYDKANDTTVSYGRKAQKFTVTTADAVVDAGDFVGLLTIVEGYNFAPYKNKKAVLTFKAKSNKTGIYCVAIKNPSDRTFISEYTIPDSNEHEYSIPVDFSLGTASGTWDYINGQGLQVSFALMAGSNWQDTGGSWQSSNKFATSNQVNLSDTNGNYFELWDVRLNEGTISLPMTYPRFEDELMRCQRYFEKSYDYLSVPGTALDYNGFTCYFFASITGACAITQSFSVPKRTAGTITIWNPQTGTAAKVGDSAGTDIAVTVSFISEKSFRLDWTPGGYGVQYQWQCSSRL